MMPTGIGPDGTDAARLSALEALIEAGAEVDARNGDGYTALRLAALALKPALVTALLQGGASASILTASQKTAAECAEQFADKNPEASAQCIAALGASAQVGQEKKGQGQGARYSTGASIRLNDSEEVAVGSGGAAEALEGLAQAEQQPAGYAPLAGTEAEAEANDARGSRLTRLQPEPEPEPEPGASGEAAQNVDIAAAAARGGSSIGFIPDAATAKALGFES